MLSAVGGSTSSSAARLLLARLTSSLIASTSSGSCGSLSSSARESFSLRFFAADAAASPAASSSTPAPPPPPPPPSPRARLLRQRKAPVALTPAAVERVRALLEKRHTVRMEERKATDGTVVCNNCLVSYENKLVDKMNSANRTIKK